MNGEMYKSRILQVFNLCIYIFLAFIYSIGIFNSILRIKDIKFGTGLLKLKYIIVIACLLIALITTVYILYKLTKNNKYGKYIYIIPIIISVLLRMLVLIYIPVKQQSDFAYYAQMGNELAANGPLAACAVIDNFGLNTLSGLAVCNGLFSLLFGPTEFGVCVGQIFVITFNIYIIYLIGSKLYNNTVGLIAATLYSVYPSNIIFTLITTNQHLETTFILLTILCLIFIDWKNIKDIILKNALSGTILCFAYYCHPSVAPILMGIILWELFVYFNKTVKFTESIIGILTVILSYYLALNIFAYIFYILGISDTLNQSTGSMLGKFVVGLNPECNGQVVSPYKGYINEYDYLAHIPAEELDAYCKRVISERLKSPTLIQLFINKEYIMWHGIDSSFDWVINAYNEFCKYNTINQDIHILRLLTNAKIIDYIYTLVLYICVVYCSIKNINKSTFKQYILQNLLVNILDIWIFVFILIEIQPRYRYQMMPLIFIIASYGIYKIINEFKNKYKRDLLNINNLSVRKTGDCGEYGFPSD